jgi:hypothetical protein
MELDGDPPLLFERVVVEHLIGRQFTRRDTSRILEKSIRKGRLPVIYMRDNAEIADALHLREKAT